MTTAVQRPREARGQALVEYALVLPILLLIVLISAGDYFNSLPQEKLETASREAAASAFAAPGGDPTLAMHYVVDTFQKDTQDSPFTHATITCPPPAGAHGDNEYLYSGRVIPGTSVTCHTDAEISFADSVVGLIWKPRHYSADVSVPVPRYRQCAPGVPQC